MKFRFQSLLELRERERDEVGIEVGKALEAIAHVENQIKQLDQDIHAVRTDDTLGRVGQVSVQALLDHGRYGMQLTQDRKALETTLAQLSDEYELRRQRLAMAQAEVKRFEILKDRQSVEARETEKRREQEVSDEAASRSMKLADRFADVDLSDVSNSGGRR